MFEYWPQNSPALQYCSVPAVNNSSCLGKMVLAPFLRTDSICWVDPNPEPLSDLISLCLYSLSSTFSLAQTLDIYFQNPWNTYFKSMVIGWNQMVLVMFLKLPDDFCSARKNLNCDPTESAQCPSWAAAHCAVTPWLLAAMAWPPTSSSPQLPQLDSTWVFSVFLAYK